MGLIDFKSYFPWEEQTTNHVKIEQCVVYVKQYNNVNLDLQEKVKFHLI